jgi:hypothetical protein
MVVFFPLVHQTSEFAALSVQAAFIAINRLAASTGEFRSLELLSDFGTRRYVHTGELRRD